MNYYIALDTSSKHLSVALFSITENNDLVQVIKAYSDPEQNSHDATLAPKVKELLELSDVPATAIKAILVSNGPGAFTGLRIGLSFAKGFAFATGCDLWLFDSLEAAEFQIKDKQQDQAPIHIMRHSHGGNYYLRSNGNTVYLKDEELTLWLNDNIKSTDNYNIVFSDIPIDGFSDSIKEMPTIDALTLIDAYKAGCPFKKIAKGTEATPFYKQEFLPSKAKEKL